MINGTAHFQKRKFQGVQQRWAVTTVEGRGTLPGNARERALTMGHEVQVEIEGVERVERPATSGEGAAGESE